MSAPKTWSRFTRSQNGVESKFKIQEATEDKYEQIFELYMKFHTPEELLRSIAGINNNEAALNEFKRIMLEVMYKEKQQILVCYVDDGSKDSRLVGASKMTLVERNAVKVPTPTNVKTKEMKDFFKLRDSLYATYNVLKEHDKIDAYFADRGLVVDPQFRGLGIAEELLKVRNVACKESNVTLYTALATAVASQKIAEKMGAKTVRELNIKDYAKQAGIPYTGEPIIVKIIVGHAA